MSGTLTIDSFLNPKPRVASTDGLNDFWSGAIGSRGLDSASQKTLMDQAIKSGKYTSDELSKLSSNMDGTGALGLWDDIGGMEGLTAGTDVIFSTIDLGNKNKAMKLAKQNWEAENARANEIMAMNRDKYNTFKQDSKDLQAKYSGTYVAPQNKVV